MSKHVLLSARMIRVCLWGGATAFAICTLIVVTHELIDEQDVAVLDRAILTWMLRVRAPQVTRVMVDLTALGSATVVALFTGLGCVVLLVQGDRPGTVHVVTASTGGWFWTVLTKDLIERARPTEIAHLVQVSGFSYPSGHSVSAAALYLTLAIVAAGGTPRTSSKVALVISASILVLLVAVSRVYLGVHYPTDVVSGVALGTAWALILAAAVALLRGRARKDHA